MKIQKMTWLGRLVRSSAPFGGAAVLAFGSMAMAERSAVGKMQEGPRSGAVASGAAMDVRVPA